MNLPNKLTVLRIILVPFYIFFLLMPGIQHHYLIALAIFGIASYTDHLDGKIARKYNMITDFGKFADPLATTGERQKQSARSQLYSLLCYYNIYWN